MSVEVYYAPTKQARRLSLSQVAEKFAAAGLPCKVEPEAEGMFWLEFDRHESNILASVEGGTFAFGTLYIASLEPFAIAETMDEVMQSIGFSADEEAEY